MNKIAGDQCAVSDAECQDKVEEITNGMIMVYNYAQGDDYIINSAVP